MHARRLLRLQSNYIDHLPHSALNRKYELVDAEEASLSARALLHAPSIPVPTPVEFSAKVGDDGSGCAGLSEATTETGRVGESGRKLNCCLVGGEDTGVIAAKKVGCSDTLSVGAGPGLQEGLGWTSHVSSCRRWLLPYFL